MVANMYNVWVYSQKGNPNKFSNVVDMYLELIVDHQIES